MQDTRPPGRKRRSIGRAVLGVLAVAVAAWAIAALSMRPDPTWQRHLPAYDEGKRWARVAVHVHSVYSHDACDYRPRPDGQANAQCLADLRQAACRNHIDVIFLTEHLEHVTSTSNLADVLNFRPGDVAIRDGGRIVGSTQHCPDGHRVHVYVGTENYVAAIGLAAPPQTDPLSLRRFYSAYSQEQVESLRRDGALILVPHAERGNISLERMREMRPDLIEAYNLHANLTATMRRLGRMTAAGRWLGAAQFLANPLLEPDLIFLAVVEEDEVALRKWAQAAAEMPLFGVLAVDAHQNLPAIPMLDGERIDSYRRTLRWLSNLVEVGGAFDRTSVLAALKGGRSYMVFEAFGTPDALDFHAMEGDKRTASGETIAANGATELTLHMTCPKVVGLAGDASQPERHVLLLRATADGWTEVARTRNTDLTYVVRTPGTYRGEVRFRPRHLAPYLKGATTLIRDVPWIYANPITVR